MLQQRGYASLYRLGAHPFTALHADGRGPRAEYDEFVAVAHDYRARVAGLGFPTTQHRARIVQPSPSSDGPSVSSCGVLWRPGKVDPKTRRDHRGRWDWPANHDPEHRGKDGAVGESRRGGGFQHVGNDRPSCLPELRRLDRSRGRGGGDRADSSYDLDPDRAAARQQPCSPNKQPHSTGYRVAGWCWR